MTIHFKSQFQPLPQKPVARKADHKKQKQPAKPKTQLNRFGYTTLFSDHELAIKAASNGSIYLTDQDYYSLTRTLPETYKIRDLYKNYDTNLWEIQITYNDQPLSVTEEMEQEEKRRRNGEVHHTMPYKR